MSFEGEKFWLVSVDSPDKAGNSSADKQYQRMSRLLDKLAVVQQFPIPSLRVGTYDTLMTLSDQLNKIDTMVENVARKIGAQCYILRDLVEKERLEKMTDKMRKKWFESNKYLTVTIGGDESSRVQMLVPGYLQKFEWIEKLFQKRLPCTEIIEQIQKTVSQTEDKFREELVKFSQTMHSIAAVERARTGNLALRDLTDVVNPSHIATKDSEYLTTVFVVCPIKSEKTWLNEYTDLAQFRLRGSSESFVPAAVPGSAIKITEEKESGLSLYSVVVLKRVENEFKQEVRDRLKFTVREIHPESNTTTTVVEEDDDEDADLKQEADPYKRMKMKFQRKANRFYNECRISFSHVFSAWIHLRCIRTHVESILRYGLPPHYESLLVAPLKPSLTKKIRKILDENFGNGQIAGEDDEDDDMPLIGGIGDKFYPYVFYEFNLDFKRD